MANFKARLASGTKHKRLNRDARRAQLLEHAIEAFAEAGIERAVHADVASRAKVSTPTVFKYFPTRAALVKAVLQEVEETFTAVPGLLLKDGYLPPSEIIKRLSKTLSELAQIRPNVVKVTLLWSVAFSDVRASFKRFETRKIDDLLNLMGPTYASRSDAYILFASMLLLARMHFDDTPVEFRNSYIDRLIEMLDGVQS